VTSVRAGYEDTVGLRNSHDKRFPIGIGFGSRVFVCDNLSFYADRVIRRKHTANMKRMLPGLIGEVVEGGLGRPAGRAARVLQPLQGYGAHGRPWPATPSSISIGKA
jgi:hypothetical protein